MSTFIGKVGTTPICHMTSDTQTQTTLEGNPISTTLFHSQLPYVFAREQFELTSYSTWGGGRTFTFSQALIDFKDANPDLACLVILEDSSGKRGIFTPTLNIIGNDYLGFRRGMSCLGNQYSCAFTSSDSQLYDMTRQPPSSGGALNYTLYSFDTADTRITVFKHAYIGTYANSTTGCGNDTRPPVASFCHDEYTDYYNYTSFYCVQDYMNTGSASPVNLRSKQTLDITKVRFVFLNITNSATTFDKQKDYSGTSSITIKDDQFSVGNIDLIKNAPIISHGLKDTSDTVNALIGTLAGGMPSTYTNGVIAPLGKLSDGGSPLSNSTPVLEFPDPETASTTMEYDFSTQVFKRDGQPVFSATTAAKGLQVIGTKELQFDFDTGTLTGGLDTFVSITTSSSGTITGAGANTLYLASMVYSGDGTTFDQVLPTCLYGVGRNRLITTHFAQVITNLRYWTAAPTFVCDIDSSGNIDIKVHRRTGNFGSNTSGITTDFGAMKLRLIAMDS